ncbi:hypothetical protein [Aquimarina sp. 2201CG14-23]|uniref:hypothetical protein n=1 Tax=Aquimarina mycalae TaxID=3040073 RepID=UPI002477E6C1|nr:hypothetical protein [Aquimarina sp. 2201CG14-23]MDH7445432.1 hypothetical protein [Aquimarina sp. 2201CG14-23]
MSAISGMNISMKNNNRRTKKEAFSHISGTSDNESQGIKIEAVSEETLIEIRQKMKQQQKSAKKRNILVAIISLFLFVLIVWATLSQM